jgi:hypothetical protein
MGASGQYLSDSLFANPSYDPESRTRYVAGFVDQHPRRGAGCPALDTLFLAARSPSRTDSSTTSGASRDPTLPRPPRPCPTTTTNSPRSSPLRYESAHPATPKWASPAPEAAGSNPVPATSRSPSCVVSRVPELRVTINRSSEPARRVPDCLGRYAAFRSQIRSQARGLDWLRHTGG